MQALKHGINAVFAFLVGDLRLLIGTFAALIIAFLVVQLSPLAAGPLLLVLIVLTLAAALWREIHP